MAGFENSVMLAKNLNFDQAGPKPHLGIIDAAGKLPIGTGESYPNIEIKAGEMISTDGSISFSYSAPNINAVIPGGTTVGKRITGNDGNQLPPTAGNWNIYGPNSSITGFSPYTTGTGSTLTINAPGVVKWVVNPVAGLGTHQTIAAAMTDAASGDDIFITQGTYTEDITWKAGVNLMAFISDALTPNVTIVGKVSCSDAGLRSASGIRFKTNGDYCLEVSGSVATLVRLYLCFLEASDHTALNYSSLSSSSGILLNYCFSEIYTTGISFFNQSSPGILSIYNHLGANSGLSSTASSASAGTTNFIMSNLAFPITNSGTHQLEITHSSISTDAISASALTIGGSGQNLIIFTHITTDTATCINVTSNLTTKNCMLATNAAQCISGAGTLNYSNLTFGAASKSTNVSTQTGGRINTGNISFDAGTNILANYIDVTSYSPVVTGSTASGSVSYTTQTGYYSRIGNMVTVTFDIEGNITGSPSGNIQVSLPLAVKSISNVSFWGYGLTQVGGTFVSSACRAQNGSSNVVFENVTAPSLIAIATGSYNLQSTITYFV